MTKRGDVEAQQISGGVLRPSNRRNRKRALVDRVKAYDVGDERAQALVERRMNWANMTQAQRTEWLLDAVTFLLAVDVRRRIDE